MLAIVEVGGVPETAAALGVAETTVKTHLHRVFSKTGASRQADLVKLAAGFSSPLAELTRPPRVGRARSRRTLNNRGLPNPRARADRDGADDASGEQQDLRRDRLIVERAPQART